jgi:hypothetical protein
LIPLRKPLPQSFPRSFRGELPDGGSEQHPVRKYEAPSVLAEYRVLSIVFGIAALALAAYFIKWMLAPHHSSAPPLPSVYVEVVPPKSEPPVSPP